MVADDLKMSKKGKKHVGGAGTGGKPEIQKASFFFCRKIIKKTLSSQSLAQFDFRDTLEVRNWYINRKHPRRFGDSNGWASDYSDLSRSIHLRYLYLKCNAYSSSCK